MWSAQYKYATLRITYKGSASAKTYDDRMCPVCLQTFCDSEFAACILRENQVDDKCQAYCESIHENKDDIDKCAEGCLPEKKVLSCGHLLCTACFALIDASDDRRCPLCRVEFPVSKVAYYIDDDDIPNDSSKLILWDESRNKHMQSDNIEFLTKVVRLPHFDDREIEFVTTRYPYPQNARELNRQAARNPKTIPWMKERPNFVSFDRMPTGHLHFIPTLLPYFGMFVHCDMDSRIRSRWDDLDFNECFIRALNMVTDKPDLGVSLVCDIEMNNQNVHDFLMTKKLNFTMEMKVDSVLGCIHVIAYRDLNPQLEQNVNDVKAKFNMEVQDDSEYDRVLPTPLPFTTTGSWGFMDMPEFY